MGPYFRGDWVAFVGSGEPTLHSELGWLIRQVKALDNVAQVVHPADGSFDLSGCDSVIEAIINIITRHPMRQEELEHALAQWTSGHMRDVLAELRASGQAQVVERYGTGF